MVTDDMMNRRALAEKSPDADVMRVMIGLARRWPMALEAGAASSLAAGELAPTATITSKGQTTIPKVVPDRLGLRSGDRLEFVVQADGHDADGAGDAQSGRPRRRAATSASAGQRPVIVAVRKQPSVRVHLC